MFRQTRYTKWKTFPEIWWLCTSGNRKSLDLFFLLLLTLSLIASQQLYHIQCFLLKMIHFLISSFKTKDVEHKIRKIYICLKYTHQLNSYSHICSHIYSQHICTTPGNPLHNSENNTFRNNLYHDIRYPGILKVIYNNLLLFSTKYQKKFCNFMYQEYLFWVIYVYNKIILLSQVDVSSFQTQPEQHILLWKL